MRHGDRVAVLSRTRLEWILLDWAVMSIGAVVVGLYPTSSAKECEYVLDHCEAVLAFTEDDEQTRKLVSVRGSLPTLREIIPFDWLEKLESDGRLAKHLQPEPVEEDDLATLIYTSGTTGPPKGCMLTHRNLVTAATRVAEAMHAAGRRRAPLPAAGAQLRPARAPGRDAIAARRSRSSPTSRACPRRWRPCGRRSSRPSRASTRRSTRTRSARSSAPAGCARRIGLWALGVGARTSRAAPGRERRWPAASRCSSGSPTGSCSRRCASGWAARLRVGVSGAAPLSTDVMEFFHALGVPVIEGYGLTETASSATVERARPTSGSARSAGRSTAAEIRLDDDGEILIRSDSVFAGYYKEPEATARC